MMSARAQTIRDYYLDSSGRAESARPNPLFAGRNTELDSVLRSAARLDRSAAPIENMTAVFYGAPGAGKSELLSQLRVRLGALDTRQPIVCLRGDIELLTNADAFAEALIRALARPGAKARMTLGAKNIAVGARLDVPGQIGAGLNVAVERGTGGDGDSGRLKRLTAEPYRKAGSPVVVLLVDEAQKKLESVSGLQNFVLPFHLGETGMKVLAIYGGLGNTLYELGQCGVTRPGDHMCHLILRLDDRHVTDMARQALRATTGQSPDVIDEWASVIAEYAQGWPMHLSHALKAVAGQAHPNGWTLDGAGFHDAMRDAEAKRVRYYGDRLQACDDLDAGQYARWARTLRRIEQVDAGHMADALDLPRSEAKRLVRQAVRAGLLEPVPEGGAYVSPIPSLLDHIESRGRARARSASSEAPTT